LVHGDPTQNIAATRDIAGVWKQGVGVDRARTIARSRDDRAPVPESHFLSDFEDGVTSLFGVGWSASMDKLAGGSSEVVVARTPGGAHGSRGCLSISGEVRPGDAVTWAGHPSPRASARGSPLTPRTSAPLPSGPGPSPAP
jgi:hypothetical protein